MWISTRPPWSSLSTFPHFMTSSLSVPFHSLQRSRPTRRYQVNQDDHAFKLRLNIPGIQLENVRVEVQDQILQITIQSPPQEAELRDSFDSASQDNVIQQGQWIFNELNTEPTSYKFTLPTSIQSDQIHAELKNGQLFLTLPKSQPLTHNIQIQHGA